MSKLRYAIANYIGFFTYQCEILFHFMPRENSVKAIFLFRQMRQSDNQSNLGGKYRPPPNSKRIAGRQGSKSLSTAPSDPMENSFTLGYLSLPNIKPYLDE